MKKSLTLTLALILCAMLCGCAEDTATAAREAYEAENYKQVIELFSETEPEDSDLQEMLSISKAHEAFNAEKYEDVVSLLDNTNNGTELEIYSESMNTLCQRAFEAKDIDTLVSLVNKDDSLSASVYTLVTEACAFFDYDAFLFMDELITTLPECSLKNLLNAYSTNAFDIRAKSFLLGEWEWQEDSLVKTRVKTYLYAENKVLGEISVLGTNLIEYDYSEGELYWKDFEFVSDIDFTCYNLVKSTYGTMLPRTVSGYLDYENSTLSIHVENESQYSYLASPDRLWTKVG